jgi:hypothetical protein
MTAKRIYIGLWGALIVMTWLQYGGNAVYVPAHARPPILARMLRLAGLGSQAMSFGVRTQGSAFGQVTRARPDSSRMRAEPVSDEKRRPTSLLGAGPTLDAGYYVAHAALERADDRRVGGEDPRGDN